MKRNILLLVPLLAALPLFAAEDMQFTTVLSYYPEDHLVSFATLETVDPTQPAEIDGSNSHPAQVRFCNVNSTSGTITLAGTPSDPETNRPVQVGNHTMGILFGDDNTGQLQSETAGEVQVKYNTMLSGGSTALTGKQLIATTIEFRGQTTPSSSAYPSGFVKNANVNVRGTLLLAPQSGTPHLKVKNATLGNLAVTDGTDETKFSRISGGTGSLSSKNTSWLNGASTYSYIPYIKAN